MGSDSLAFSVAAWIIYLPILGFLFQAFFGGMIIRKFGPATGKQICGIAAFLAIAIPFVFALAAAMSLGTITPSDRQVMVQIAPWIDLKSLNAPFELFVDPLSITMALIVTGVGALIHLYATGYMAEDRDYARFFTYMNLFITSMLTLVLGGNLILMFLGWEGVGLCSYLLIGFWYKDQSNARAGNKAFIFNRIGDFGFMLGMFLVFVVMTAQYATIADNRMLSFDNLGGTLLLALHHQPTIIATIAALSLFMGACGKSAQFPLYSWLPDAMAGPTPVSALIHAATMVTAGVYMINRMWPVFAHSPVASTVVACVGAFTALFAALIAFGQTDIKKVLAYSTVSQLGYMFLACGAGAYGAGMFHVVTHAFFKGLLFLGAGAVIHAMAHNQDMRNYGNLQKYMKVTTWTMVVGCLAIAGFPFMSGFFSKEQILAAAIGPRQNTVVLIAGWAGMFTAILTAVYMVRLTALTFFGKEERWRKLTPVYEEEPETHTAVIEPSPDDPHHFFFTAEEITARDAAANGHASHGADDPSQEAVIHSDIDMEDSHHPQLGPDFTPKEVSVSMAFPLIVLAIFSLGAGYFMRDGQFETWLAAGGSSVRLHAEPHIPWLPYVGSAAALLGIAVGMLLYMHGLPEKEGWDLAKWNPFRKWAANQFGWDKLATEGSTLVGGAVAHIASDGVEAYGVEGAVNSVVAATGGVGLLVRKLQTGYVRFYAFLMLIGVVAFLGWILYLAQAGRA